MKFYSDVYLPELPAEEPPQSYLRRLSLRLTEIFRDIAAAFDNPQFTGLTKINRWSDVPNEQYDLYTATAAAKIDIHGTLAAAIQHDKNNFVFSVRPTISLAGTSGHPATFRAYDFDVTVAASTVYDAGYGVIGALNVSGAGSFKGVYGRSAAAAGFTGVTVGVVGGANFVATQSDAYALQLDITGPDTSSLPTNLATGILVGSNNAGSKSHLGIYFNNQVSYNNAVVRWNQRDSTEGAYFLEQLNSGATTRHAVDYLGRTTYARDLALVGNGTPFLVAAANQTGQTSDLAAATLFTPAADGYYRLSLVSTVTTAGSTSSTLGATFARWTDANGNVVKTRASGTDATNTTATAVGITTLMYCKSGTAIQYGSSGYATSGATAMQFDLSAVVEYLG